MCCVVVVVIVVIVVIVIDVVTIIVLIVIVVVAVVVVAVVVVLREFYSKESKRVLSESIPNSKESSISLCDYATVTMVQYGIIWYNMV